MRSALGRLLRRLGLPRTRSAEEAEALRLPPMTGRMQAFSMVVVFVAGIALTWFAVANPLGLPFLPAAADRSATPAAPEPEQTPTLYQCPMHPQVIESTPGTCPICGMELVPMKSAGAAAEPSSESGATGSGARSAAAATGEREILYWYAPMDPTYIRDEPGLSPMGMKLVPKYADEGGTSRPGEISIDPVQVQNIGVVSVPAATGDIARTSRTVGILDFNADNVTWVNTKYSGWVEKVYVNYVGQKVTQGQALFEIYSPELVTTQEEYLRALEYRTSLRESGRPETIRQAESLVQAARERLSYWDITDDQIHELEQRRTVRRRLTVTSPAEGVVAEVMSEALEGMFVKPGMNLYKITDLSTVWVHADIYELDIPWIRTGQPADISFRNDPERSFRGKVLFLFPQVDKDTRTLKICVEVPNSKQRLRPGMYADVVVYGPPVRDAVVVPQSAVIRSGERNIIFVDLGDGHFEPREVELGVNGENDRLQIVSGLAAGERVVIQAQFMLDSESRIQQAIAQFRDRGANEKAAERRLRQPDGQR